MKWKIIWLNVITVLMALLFVTGGYFALINMKEVDTVKDILRNYNNFIINYSNSDYEVLNDLKINNKNVRFTVVDKSGKVIYDSLGKELENHGDREEIVNAFENGEYTSVRTSNTQNGQVVYVASKANENYVIRSSMAIDDIKIFYSQYLVYYIVVIVLVIIVTISLSLKLVKSILYPIKELKEVTAKIAKGDFSKKAKVTNSNEIGSLAKTFNSMADELKERIEDSQDKQNKLECILESMDSGVIALDNKEKIILINPYAKKIFNIKDNVIGEDFKQFIKNRNIIDFINNLPALNKAEIAISESGERILKLKKAPIIQEESYPMGTVIVISDVTEVRKLEIMRSQFVANVSHELKTPLTSIKGFTETLRFVNDEEKREKFLSIIESETDRLTGLINDILSLSRIESTNNMKGELFAVQDVITKVISMVESLALKNNITINTEISANNMLKGEEDKFYQLVLNLVENAVKYSGADSTVTIRTYVENDEYILVVEDNGIGIPKEDEPRIFERFYRVDKARGSAGVNGTGLGLSIVKHIVRMFEGDITCSSTLGKGTIFKVKLKLKG